MTRPNLVLTTAATLAAALVLGGCSTSTADGTAASTAAASQSDAAGVGSSAALALASSETAGTVFDASEMHTISIDVDPEVLTGLLTTYADSSSKDWASASVTIDGTTFENVGIKLKGNSSLQGVSANSDPTSLPWRIRLDKYVDGQNLDGFTDFNVRPNGSASSLNEAVTLDMLADAGLASDHAIATSFSVNGSEEVLRLTVQIYDETWVNEYFPDAGADSVLYKIDGNVKWDYLGEDTDGTLYGDSFDVKAGPSNYVPLSQLLDLINNGTADEIAEKLPEILDVDSFATYIALEELVDNFDTISGPGNNGYLFWDSTTEKFTVVAWDHDRAFGVQLAPAEGGPGGGGGAGGPGGVVPDGVGQDDDAGARADGAGQAGRPGRGPGGGPGGGVAPTDMPTDLPDGFPTDLPTDLPDGFPSDMPTDGTAPQGAPGAPGEMGQGGPGGMVQGGPGGRQNTNPLSAAITNNAEWSALVSEKLTSLREELYASGLLAESVEAWSAVIATSGLVPSATLESEASSILSYAASDGSASRAPGRGEGTATDAASEESSAADS